ncbi:hypothetical protein NMY22_g3288 [Coprinellus aureogranulatus]|nr:hypothetical protein NMY22_g3288 [Coprinellus aureogranulatus]
MHFNSRPSSNTQLFPPHIRPSSREAHFVVLLYHDDERDQVIVEKDYLESYLLARPTAITISTYNHSLQPVDLPILSG